MPLWITCYMCDDYLIWVQNGWYCPSCDADLIETLKYKFTIIEVEE